MMSELSPPSDWRQMELPSMPSAEASPAKTYRTQALALVLAGPGPGSGLNMPDSLASYDPASSSWRTSQLSLVEGLTVFSETWPRSGMTRSGIAYPLPPLAPLTFGTGFGSSPTHSVPTPTASDHIERKCTSSEALNFETNKSVSLDRWVRRWPTPTARDWKDGRSIGSAPKNGLLGRVVDPSPEDGSLNPTWVEWLMGFPIGWTDLRPSETR